jgi:hypothetical protein
MILVRLIGAMCTNVNTDLVSKREDQARPFTFRSPYTLRLFDSAVKIPLYLSATKILIQRITEATRETFTPDLGIPVAGIPKSGVRPHFRSADV